MKPAASRNCGLTRWLSAQADKPGTHRASFDTPDSDHQPPTHRPRHSREPKPFLSQALSIVSVMELVGLEAELNRLLAEDPLGLDPLDLAARTLEVEAFRAKLDAIQIRNLSAAEKLKVHEAVRHRRLGLWLAHQTPDAFWCRDWPGRFGVGVVVSRPVGVGRLYQGRVD